MKKVLAMLLVVMMLGGSALSAGCSVVTRGSNYCEMFLDHIAKNEFEAAYEMIADSIKAPETAEERDKRLAAEAKEKQKNKDFWKEVFGFKDEEPAADTPTPTPEATDTPAPEDALATSTPEPVAENGLTPNPETGEYPEIEPTPTPDPNATPDPDATPTPRAKLFGRTPTPSPDPNATPTPTPAPVDADGNPLVDKTITKVGFVEKYQSIFDELMVDPEEVSGDNKGVEYTITNVTDGEIIAIIDYELTYYSERAGEPLTYTFSMTANRIEHRWTIDWSPNLIFPMMEWGDNLRVGTLQSNRGEILCDGVAYAQNVNIITVFAVPSAITDTEQFIRDTASIPELELTEDDVREALSKARNDFSKIQTFFPDEFNLDLEKRILEVKGLSIDTANYGTQRYYPYGESLCHIIGYAGIISKKEKVNYEVYGDIIYNKETQRFESNGATRYNGDSWIGKYGLELLYEQTLLGTNGRFTYIQDTKGGSRGMLYKTDAIDGQDLHLTIKPELQERLEDIVDNVVYDDTIHGTVVVMNPQTGAIQAMTSWPGFDLNYLARGMPAEEWEALQNHPDIPLYNRGTQGLYTPGSVFKLMTSGALLETNSMAPGDVFPLSEEIDIDSWIPSESLMATLPQETFGTPSDNINDPFIEQANGKPLKRTHSDSRPTPMNLNSSIISSDNLYFAYAALRMGAKRFEEFMTKIGWNEAIQLEADGTYPRIYWRTTGAENVSWSNVAEGGETIWEQDESGEWVPMVRNGSQVGLVLDKDPIYGLDVSVPQLYSTDKAQSDYDLAVSGYGQGQILMSPLQMACYASAYANNGVIMQPYLIDSIWHASGTDYTLIEQRQPKEYRRIFQQATVDTVYPSLKEVCLNGTARYLCKSFITKAPFTSLGYTFAGKTGTAEITNNKTKELAWFICWRDTYSEAPGVPPELVGQKVSVEDARMCCVLLEVNLPMGTEWSQMKFDIARAMLKYDVLNNDLYGQNT